jgi:hypothetical protein
VPRQRAGFARERQLTAQLLALHALQACIARAFSVDLRQCGLICVTLSGSRLVTLASLPLCLSGAALLTDRAWRHVIQGSHVTLICVRHVTRICGHNAGMACHFEQITQGQRIAVP